MSGSRYVIGVDLGTTNSAAAFADLSESLSGFVPRVRVFPVPQLVAEGEVAARETLPSFLYVPTAEERGGGRLDLPWAKAPAHVAGEWARDHGALVPTRLVSSAKSWLCHDAVDRHAPLLPWTADPADRAVSPVEASTAYLLHVRDAWNAAHAAEDDGRFEDQAITLTVPASFDEEARELTIEAARAAAVTRLTLVEEPTAALYAWIGAHAGRLATHLRDGDLVLVCDVGGGTSDFTLVAVSEGPDGPAFERTRVGEHLLLGGDNVDVALAHLVEERLGRPRLTLTQQYTLRRQCAAAKERLLGPPRGDRALITLLGSGRSLVGGTLSTELTHEDVLKTVLDGFLPAVGLEATPDTERRIALRELGLPFASDPAITRHLAAFLRADGAPARPDVVLFNGGFFTPPETRDRVVDVVRPWFADTDRAWAPRVLENRSPATAVAEGAAYYGLARLGRGLRIGGGSPRAFYLGLRRTSEGDPASSPHAVCVLPRGTMEGTAHDVPGTAFAVTTNRPLAFTLWSHLSGHDSLGAVTPVDAGFHRHSPLVTELRYGKRSRQVELPVTLAAEFTELGTLELWLAAQGTEHRWRLQFQLRRPEPADIVTEESGSVVAAEDLDRARGLVGQVFAAGAASGGPGPDGLMAAIEQAVGLGRHAWPMSVIRPLADLLLERAEGRRHTARHEARFLNLLGFCLRPGFGATRDDARMGEARKIFLAGQVHANDVQTSSEWLVMWQRVGGGLSAGQQQDVFQRYAPQVGVKGARSVKRLPPQVERETLKLLASLERLPAPTRTAVGEAVATRVRKEPGNGPLLWALARTGARVPFHGPLNTVVPPAVVAAWVEMILALGTASAELATTVAQLGAFTGDPARDLPEDLRQRAHGVLVRRGVDPARVAALVELRPSTRADRQALFGETLPEGLTLATQ